MSRTHQLECRWCVVVLLGASSTAAWAQAHRGQKPAIPESDETITTQLVKTGLYLISGGGANSLLRFSANGLILVDGKSTGNYRAFMSQVKRTSRISDLPIRYLVLTDHHADRSANNEQFVADGVRLVAQSNVARHLAAQKPGTTEAAPLSIAYDRERTIHLGGVEVQLLHFGTAHTDADSVVYFPNLRVVAVGDLVAPTPQVDYAAGGSLLNWPTVLAEVLKLDFDVVVPSRGPSVGRAEVAAFQSKLDTLIARGRALVSGGVPRDQLLSRLKIDDLGWRFDDYTGTRLDALYAELSAAR